MALVRNDALAEYGSGPRRQKSRGFVTVREPAKGFFIAGSCIEDLNGVYAPVRESSATSLHKMRLAYRNDQNGWLMALIITTPASRRRFKEARGRVRLAGSSEESSEDETLGMEWCLIDPAGRDRFAHKGDTVIPGAGHRWWHLHRPSLGAKPVEEVVWYDAREDEYETAAEDEDEFEARGRAQRSGERRELIEAQPDDEDELPWQIIALLDFGVVQDLRAARRNHERQINAAKAGKNLPKPGPACLEACCRPGCWMFRVSAERGVEVRTAPSNLSRKRGRVAVGEYLRGIEQRGSWLRLSKEYSRGHDSGSESDNNEPAELWVAMEGADGNARLVEVREEDGISYAVPADDGPEADLFDRPFEPRLEEPGAENQNDEAEDENDDATINEDCDAYIRAALPSWTLAERAVGDKICLEGLSDPTYNGEFATVATPLDSRGRHVVCLTESGARISVKVSNLRPPVTPEVGTLGHAAWKLGLTLTELGLGRHDGDNTHHLHSGRERLEAGFRAVQRDALEAASTLRAEWELAYKRLEAAFADMLATHDVDAGRECNAREQVHGAFDCKGCIESNNPLPPHMLVESGVLGTRAAIAGRLAGNENSIANVEEGVRALRQLLADEHRRLSRCAGVTWPPRAAELPRAPPESADSLRLRLTLVRALLRCRRDDEALKEVRAAVRAHPYSAAALQWQGRCLLRLARREEGLQALGAAVNVGPSGGCDSEWGHMGAASRLKALRRGQRCRIRAEDEYARGNFAAAATRYGEALASTPSDDKWGRATLLANRAACYRRERSLRKAIEDCDVALALFPRYGRALFRRAACLLEAGLSVEAVRAFEVLLGIDREWPDLCNWLVRAHAHVKRSERNDRSRFASTKPKRGNKCPGDEVGVDGELNGSDYYSVLGVSQDATEKQLKRAYRLMSLKYHPDKEGGSTRAFQLIATAYKTLSDVEKRALYDDGADVKKGRGASDSESESGKDERSLREEVERKYFPERYKFWPFGDPFIEKRKLIARRSRRMGEPKWHQKDDWEPVPPK